jgi:hypothetical protein
MLVSNRATNILLVLILAVGIGIVAILASGARGGPLDPTAPPSSTLPQIEPRMPIDHVPFTISQTGSYYLTGNLAVAFVGQNGITVNANHVSIDLNGFQLLGAGTTGTGILVGPGPLYGLALKNGALGGWNLAIDAANGRQDEFSDLALSGNAGGIQIGDGSEAWRINSSYNTGTGIILGSHDAVSDSVIVGDGIGIYASASANGGQILTNIVEGNNGLYGIAVSGTGWRVEGNNVAHNGGSGILVNGTENVVVRNTMTQNSLGNSIAAGNYGPIEGGPVTNPLSNIDD